MLYNEMRLEELTLNEVHAKKLEEYKQSEENMRQFEATERQKKHVTKFHYQF